VRKEDHFYVTFSLSLFIYFYFFHYSLFLTLFLSLLTAYLSWLPDIDIKVLRKIDKIKKTHKIVYFLLFPIFWLVKKIFRHRTITHTLWIPLLLAYLDLFDLFNEKFEAILRVLYLSLILHILEDSLTKTGVKLFYPLDLKLKIPLFSTSKEADSLKIKTISFFLILIFILLIFHQLFPFLPLFS